MLSDYAIICFFPVAPDTPTDNFQDIIGLFVPGQNGSFGKPTSAQNFFLKLIIVRLTLNDKNPKLGYLVNARPVEELNFRAYIPSYADQ